MEIGVERQNDSYIRSKLSWTKVVSWAVLAAVLVFLPFDWNGCGFFRHGAREVLHFGYAFAWLVIFLALRTRWRLLLLVVTIPPVFLFFGLHGIAEENAGPEAAAVSGLRQIQTSVEAYRREHQQEFPESLPSTPLPAYQQKFYKYEYVPSRDTTRKLVGYVVQATPTRRDCDFYISFTIADDGKVFYTFEPRAATTADKVLE